MARARGMGEDNRGEMESSEMEASGAGERSRGSEQREARTDFFLFQGIRKRYKTPTQRV